MNENTRALPERPSLEQLRKQARDLQSGGSLSLSEAQLRLAREYGFASWPKLKHHVEELLGLRSALEAYVEAALGGRATEAQAVLDRLPDLAAEPAVICLSGDVSRIGEIDPQARYAPRDWTGLLYACFSRIGDRLPVVRYLLERGADPNAYWIHPQYPDSLETPLYAAVGLHNDPELTRLLLEHGATPTDNEALYHGTEHADHRSLRLVLEAGGRVRDQNALPHMLDRDDLEGLRLILQFYGPPGPELDRALQHAISHRRSAEHVRLLLDHGADPRQSAHGFTTYAGALLMNQPETAALLAENGADTALSAEIQAVVDCIQGRSNARVELPTSLQWVLVYLARDGDLTAVTRLLDAGADVNARAHRGETALHFAGWAGRAEVVRLLLERGADLSLTDNSYGGTPLNWAIVGMGEIGGDHLRTIEAMLEHGAGRFCQPSEFLRERTRDFPEIRQLLARYGVEIVL